MQPQHDRYPVFLVHDSNSHRYLSTTFAPRPNVFTRRRYAVGEARVLFNTRYYYYVLVVSVIRTGNPILDCGLCVTWGNGNYWQQVDEATSLRGRIWRLNQVCWLAVSTVVQAPCPGLYAAFFRIRRHTNFTPFLHFSAEWKADAAHTGQVAFLHDGGHRQSQGPISRQDSEAVVSWSHRRLTDLTEDVDPGEWMLLHIGNVVVRDRTHGVETTADEMGGLDVALSFGGNNPTWCGNLDVDLAAIVPMQLSWDIARVIWIGHIKGLGGGKISHHGEGGKEDAGPPQVGISPLSQIPEGLIRLILDYSQPTLIRNVNSDELNGHLNGNNDGSGGWRVF